MARTGTLTWEARKPNKGRQGEAKRSRAVAIGFLEKRHRNANSWGMVNAEREEMKNHEMDEKRLGSESLGSGKQSNGMECNDEDDDDETRASDASEDGGRLKGSGKTEKRVGSRSTNENHPLFYWNRIQAILLWMDRGT